MAIETINSAASIDPVTHEIIQGKLLSIVDEMAIVMTKTSMSPVIYEVLDFAVEVYSNEVGLDEILLHIVPARVSDEADHRIRAYLQARLRVSPHIEYLTQEQMLKKQFPEAARKAIKFIDRR